MLFRFLASSRAFGFGPAYRTDDDRAIETAIGFFVNPFIDRRAIAQGPWPHWQESIPERRHLEPFLSTPRPTGIVESAWERLLQFVCFRDRHLEPNRIDLNDLHQRIKLRGERAMRLRYYAMRTSSRRNDLQKFIHALAVSHETDRPLEKYPFHYLVLPELLSVFPNARFVFMSRNPVTVYRSLLRRARLEISQQQAVGIASWMVLAAPAFAEDWNRAAACLSAFRSHWPHAVLHLRYEDVVGDTRSSSERLARFLEIESTSWTVADPFPSVSPGIRFFHRGSTPVSNALEHLPELDSADRFQIGSLTARAARELGYELDQG
jgi:hypothetical protein